MLFGEFERTIDQKGRLSLPSHVLQSAEDGEWNRVIVLRGEETCLYLYDLATWEAILNQAFRSLPDDEARLFMHRSLADAQPSEIDTLKRITVPSPMLQYAGIERRVVLVGMFNRLELWEPDVWHAYVDAMEDIELPSIADLSRARIREVS